MRRQKWPVLSLGFVACISAGATGCASGRATSSQDRVFYQTTDAVAGPAGRATEWAYPPLDAPAAPELPAYEGVSLFDGGVRLSRPEGWAIRLAGGPPGRRYVEYDSPHAYLFTVYELADSVDSWADVLTEYEGEAVKAGAEFLSQRVPMATANAQGLGYVLRRTVPGAKGPLVNFAHEYVLRGEHRIVLAQIVHHGAGVDGAGAELRRVFETFEIR
ncbi:MAG: hypothetical protein ABSC94_13215 [Polyangiaceae bacterium]